MWRVAMHCTQGRPINAGSGRKEEENPKAMALVTSKRTRNIAVGPNQRGERSWAWQDTRIRRACDKGLLERFLVVGNKE